MGLCDSPPPRIVHRRLAGIERRASKPRYFPCQSTKMTPSGTQRDTPPQCNEQLAGQCHDHGLALLPSGDAGLKPLHQAAIFLVYQETPRQLDHAATDACALPALARPFSRRRDPLSSGEPVRPTYRAIALWPRYSRVNTSLVSKSAVSIPTLLTRNRSRLV